MKRSHVKWKKRALTYGFAVLVFTLAVSVSLSYRSIFGTDLRDYIHRADGLYFNHQLPPTLGAISSVFYPLMIALTYPLVGHTLLATHLLNVIMWLCTPVLFFFLLRRILDSEIWALIGSLLYIGYPTNAVLLNQNSTEIIIVFWLVVTLLLIEYARTRPVILLLAGITCALMVLTRLFDGLLFTAVLGVAVLYEHRKNLPLRWITLGAALFIGVQWVSSWILDYSLLELSGDYIGLAVEAYFLPAEQNASVERDIMLNVGAYVHWFLGQQWFPVFLSGIILGLFRLLKKNRIAPVLVFAAYSSFLVFFLGGGFREMFFLRQAVKVILPLVILLVFGAKAWYEWLNRALGRIGKWIAPCIFVVIFSGCGVLFYRQNVAFTVIMKDIIPPATLFQIIQKNPELPKFPATGTGVALRENMIKAVTGAYRPSYLSKLAQRAWDGAVPDQERARADFSWYADFSDETSWKSHVVEISGTSPLWTAERPGHLGAFPYQAEGTLVYKFSFPRKARKIVLSDIHKQWAPGDVLRMWTSSDGEEWTVRHERPLRYQKIYYHEVLTEEISGIETLYVKYYFYAGDPERDASDNRGAALDEFSLAVTFQDE